MLPGLYDTGGGFGKTGAIRVFAYARQETAPVELGKFVCHGGVSSRLRMAPAKHINIALSHLVDIVTEIHHSHG
jgi:hypothetical protein